MSVQRVTSPTRLPPSVGERRPRTECLLLGTLLALTGTAALSAQASLAGPRLFPRGARSAGIVEASYDAATISYLFTLKTIRGATVVQYRVPIRHPTMVGGVLRVEETTTGVVPMAGGGLSYRVALPGAADVGTLVPAYDLAFSPAMDPIHAATLLSHVLDPVTGVLTLRYRDTVLAGTTRIACEKEYAIRLVGKSLEIHATGDATVRNAATYNYAGFAFGDGDALPQPNLAFHVPYMDMTPVFVGANGAFVTRIVDWYRSSASEGVMRSAPATTGATFHGETAPAVYANDLGDNNAPIDETVYLTVSTAVEDVMPVVDRPPSAYRLHLADRAVSQAAPGATYVADHAWLSRAARLGLADMAHIKWDWNKWPFNLNEPDRIPAAPGVACGSIWGSQQEWLAYANAAARANWTFAPYFVESANDHGYPPIVGQNTLLLLPGSAIGQVQLTANPIYNVTHSVRDRLNQLKLGWDTEQNLAGTNIGGQNPPVGHPTDILGAHLRAGYLGTVADAIHGGGGYTPFPVAGAHTDAAAGLPDWIEIDQRSGSGFPKTVAENLKWREQSFGALKDGLDGPLFGENSHWRAKAFETYAMGLLDGTSRKIPIHWSPAQGAPGAENKDYLVVPDFELSEVLPRAAGNFGMGWESHFSNAGPWGFDDGFVDAWHATTLSYGHAPYFGTNGDVPNNYWDWRRTIRSYYLCYGVSKAMRSSTITAVRYEDTAGVERSLSAALVLVAQGSTAVDLSRPRLALRFANGLVFKANHSATDWTTRVLGLLYVIPPNGFVAADPAGLLAMSAINPASGRRVDYAFNPGHSEVIDRRGFAQSVNGFPGALLPVPASLPVLAAANDTQMVIVRDLRENRAVYGSGLDSGTVALGPSPAPVGLAIAIDDTAVLSPGRPRVGLRAVLTDGLGNTRDVTGLCQWSSSAPSTVKVNRFGGTTIVGVGSASITAFFGAASLSATRVLQATRAPQLGSTTLQEVTSARAFLSCTTDIACTCSLQLQDTVTGTVVTVGSVRDPAQKTHQFFARNLVALRNYVATVTATNAVGQTTVGAPFAFTTP